MTKDTRLRTVGDRQPINPNLGEGRYQDALRRLRARIADGLKLSLWDDTTPGDKDTQCSWGMCTETVEQWPDVDDHVWPVDFVKRGRIAPRDLGEGQFCPHDRKDDDQVDVLGSHGCFYRCNFFSPKKLGPLPDRAATLAAFDKVIAEHEARGRKTAADDDEPWRDPAVSK